MNRRQWKNLLKFYKTHAIKRNFHIRETHKKFRIFRPKSRSSICIFSPCMTWTWGKEKANKYEIKTGTEAGAAAKPFIWKIKSEKPIPTFFSYFSSSQIYSLNSVPKFRLSRKMFTIEISYIFWCHLLLQIRINSDLETKFFDKIRF